MLRRISLANKCLLLFGLAVVMIIAAALAVAWVRLTQLVDEGELGLSRKILQVWEAAERRPATVQPPVGFSPATRPGLLPGERLNVGDARVAVYDAAQVGAMEGDDASFVKSAWAQMSGGGGGLKVEVVEVRRTFFQREYKVARSLRNGVFIPAAGGEGAGGTGGPQGAAPESMAVLQRVSESAGRTVLINTGFLLCAGLIALALALLVFYLITNKIILSPVRSLRRTAERVRAGQIDQRSDIHTGDEFEELAETFNEMLGNMQLKQDQLRALNASLDDKLTEIEQRNMSLFEAMRLKGEFLANVTHELRTPLNSIIGFAELLDEQIQRDHEALSNNTATTTPAVLAKRKRYVDNITQAGRSLLDLINGLLEMAKVEAGKMELQVVETDAREVCETLLAMMKPLADKRHVELRFEPIGLEDLPTMQTDGRKLQQILYNLLSNAIKFTADFADARVSQMAMMDPEAAEQLSRMAVVTLRAERLVARSESEPGSGAGEGLPGGTGERVRLSVLDTGPGIAPVDQARIFEKFTQLDGGHQRKHSGTGLGLSIVKELTLMLQGEIQVFSEVGRGAMFSVILPVRLDPGRSAESKLEMGFRGALSSQKSEGR